MTSGGVRIERHGHVAELVLDRGRAMNALSTEMARSLAAACAVLAADASVRVVLVTSSAPTAFCVGADLKERATFTDAALLAQRPVFRAAFAGVLELPQPVVAAVHGFALGGGTEIALCADLVVAADDAVLGLPEVRVGLVPGGGGTQLAVRRLGAAKAADLVLTGRDVAAAEAYEMGLVDRLVAGSRAEVHAAALELAQQIAANSPVGLRAAKQAMRLGAGTDLRSGLDLEDAAWRTAAFSGDRREGIAAFVEKRRPSWPGVQVVVAESAP